MPMWRWLICGVLGLGLGVGSALAVSGGLFSDAKLVSGRWSTDPTVGAAAANPWLRATIARVGLLALTKEETVYFNRDVDDDGAKLVEGCTYALMVDYNLWGRSDVAGQYGCGKFYRCHPRPCCSCNDVDGDFKPHTAHNARALAVQQGRWHLFFDHPPV